MLLQVMVADRVSGPAAGPPPGTRMTDTAAITAARRAHSTRCRQRVIKAVNDAVAGGEEISISAIARKAGVDRSLLYQHRDLHVQLARRVPAAWAKAARPAIDDNAA